MLGKKAHDTDETHTHTPLAFSLAVKHAAVCIVYIYWTHFSIRSVDTKQNSVSAQTRLYFTQAAKSGHPSLPATAQTQTNV